MNHKPPSPLNPFLLLEAFPGALSQSSCHSGEWGGSEDIYQQLTGFCG
jgi:hypothetical protein